jgi:hypothetical protein
MKTKRFAVVAHSERPHWIDLEWLDDEAKRQLELKDRPRKAKAVIVALLLLAAVLHGQDFVVNNQNGTQQVCSESQGTVYCR